MIKINIEKNNTKIISLEISGHSNYDEKGKDIVCAGVSAVVVGGINCLVNESKHDIKYECKEGYSYIFVKKIDNENIQRILDVITTQLYTIEESYPKFVKIIEK